MRDPNKLTVEALLSSDDQFVVPSYQRGYDWKGNAQVKDLFMDFEACLKSSHNDELFLGTMIFDVSEEKQGRVYVIDGQQRITTLSIVLIACRTYAKRIFKNEKLALTIQRSIANDDELVERDDPDYADVSQQLIPSTTIDWVFNRMTEYEWDEKFPSTLEVDKIKRQVKRKNSRIRPVYDQSMSEIERLCSNDITKFRKLVRQVTKKSYIIKIDIEKREEAFEIFERTNARGIGLEIADLLKNYLFSKNNEVHHLDVEIVWKEISDNAGSSILRMLKYFWISRRGHVATRDLYRNIREYAQKNGTTEFVLELREFSLFFAAYESKDRTTFPDWLVERGFKKNAAYLNESARTLGALKTFRITQVVPLIYSITQSYLKEEERKRKPKTFLSLLRLIEYYHFVNSKVCDSIGNEVEKLYSDFSEKFFETSDFSQTMGEFKAAIVPNFRGKDEFIAKFKGLSYVNQTERVLIRYIFDMLANDGVKDGGRIDLLSHFEVSNNIRGAFDIEHLRSQSSISSEDEADFTHEIGNLLVIPKQINGILSDDDFPTKLDKLLHPHKYDNNIKHPHSYIVEFANSVKGKDEWSRQDITSRTRELALLAYSHATQRYTYK